MKYKTEEIRKCARCNSPFITNLMIVGDDVCRTCDLLNSITFWYPRLYRLNFPMPKTIIIHTNLPLEMLNDKKIPKGTIEFLEQIKHAATKLGGHPVFLELVI